MRKSIYVVTSIIGLLLVSACKPSKNISVPDLAAAPDTFMKQDSVQPLPLNWNDYFSDSLLIALIDTAIRHNLDVRVALQRIEQAGASVRFAKGTILPTVHGGATAAVRRFGLYTMDGAGNSTTEIEPGLIVPTNLPDYLVGLQTSWEADVWGKLRNRKKAAAARYLSSIEGKNWLTTTIVAEVASSYYRLLALDRELSMIRENITLQSNAVEIVKLQKEAGATNELAVQQFQAQLLNTRGLEMEVRQQVIEEESHINYLLGRFTQFIPRYKELFQQQVPLPLQAGKPVDVLQSRPDVKQAELEMLASRADVKSAKAAFYPSLVINGGIGLQAFKTEVLFTTPESFIFSLIGSLSTPLLNRSAIRAEFKAANARQVESIYNYQQRIIQGYNEVYNELNSITNLQQIYTIKNEEVEVLYKSIETSTELFKTGRATYLEVLLAQQKALYTQLDLVEVRRKQLQASVNVYKAMGGGWK
ncbi:MAG: RND transporter [Azospira oryzae]|nr:MAG: RND transporter [Azospira oryzae]